MIKQTALSDGESRVEVSLLQTKSTFNVSLSSRTDDDLNVTYTFNNRPLADQCFKVECERLVKIGFKIESEVNYSNTPKKLCHNTKKVR